MKILKQESVIFNWRGSCLFCVIVFCSLFLFVGCINGGKKKKENTTESSESTEKSEPKSRAKFPIELDYTKDYPTKDVDLAEIADIEYVSFKDEGVLFDGTIGNDGISISDKYIILANSEEGTVFIFDRDGKLLNKFNKKGRSGKEYTRIMEITVDFKNKEIFVFDFWLKYKIMVYSFEGEFKRSFQIPSPLWVDEVVDYDEKYLLAHFYVPSNQKAKPNPMKTDNIFYYLISKSTGKFTPAMNVVPKEIIRSSATIFGKNGKSIGQFEIAYYTIIKNGLEALISDFGSDTIYMSKGVQFTPFIVKSPPVVNSNEPILVSVLLKTDKYTFVDKCIRRLDDMQSKRFMIDNHTGEIFEPNLIFNDRLGKSISLDASHLNAPQNHLVDLLSTFRYVECNENGELKGKLKEFVSTLKDDDNNFLRIIKFKE